MTLETLLSIIILIIGAIVFLVAVCDKLLSGLVTRIVRQELDKIELVSTYRRLEGVRLDNELKRLKVERLRKLHDQAQSKLD